MTRRTMWILITTAMVLALQAAIVAQVVAHYAHHGQYALPDPKATPGDVDTRLIVDVTGAKYTTDGAEANLCAKDFRTGPWRRVSEAEKKAACRAYGITTGCPGPRYEVDHIISLEIGGSDSVSNLWPQPIAQARIKDHQVEDRLPKLVCAGKMSIIDAQRCVADDWVACAARIKALE